MPHALAAGMYPERRSRSYLDVHAVRYDATPYSDGGASCASKAGLITRTAALAQELGPHKINVNIVATGAVDVEWEQVTEQTRADQQATVRQTPWGRMGTPADIAHVVPMLCAPQADSGPEPS